MLVAKSEKIRTTLKESGLKQSDLAKKLGISRQQLNEILKENRKSKYLDQIASLLKMPELAKDKIFSEETLGAQNFEASDIQRLPLVFPEDILRIWEGHQSMNHLSKPFYNILPFVQENQDVLDHFCLRMNEYLNSAQGHTLGAFHLYLPLKLVPGRILLVYLKASKKLTLGTLEINTETDTKSIVNNKGIYAIAIGDIILAECSQFVSFL